MENFEDRINQILLAAALVSLAIGLFREGYPDGLIEGASICFALLIIIVVGSVQNYNSERRLADLVKLSEAQDVSVIRGGRATKMKSDFLVVGDIYQFGPGMKIPADSIMIDGQDVMVKQPELTGEPDELPRVTIAEDNYTDGSTGTLLAKSEVSDGFGVALVLAVGPKTVAGAITART
jgi:Ca2+-transporting ATPase